MVSIISLLGYDNNNNNNKTIEDEIKSLKEQMDKDRNNQITKDELDQYFILLASAIDKNSDGKITKDELELYVTGKLGESNKEIEKWKQAYENLRDEYENLLDQIGNNNNNNKIVIDNGISTKGLKDYIEKEIMKSDANIKLIPDPLERKVYLTMYKTIMKSIEKLCNTTTIDLIGHQISFSIRPLSEDKQVKITENHE